MKNLTWQNPEQLFVAQELINKVKSKCCGIKVEEISEAIIHHCMLYFTSNDVPLMRIYYDEDKDNAIVLNNLFSEVIKFDREPQNTNIDGEDSPFTLHYIRNYANRAHSMHLCANKREVGKKISLSSYIPSFVRPLQDNLDKKYYLSVYVTGNLLDRRVNSQRTKFSIPLKKDDDNAIFNSICLQDIFNSISENVKKEYKKNIEEAEKEKDNRVRNYILDKKKPRLAYRHLIGIDGAFDNIPADATDERIEVELHKGEFYQFNLSSCIRQQNSLTAQFVSFSLSNLANIFYPPPQFLQ